MGVFDGHAEGQSLYLYHLQCHSGHPPSRPGCLQQLISLLSGGYGFRPRPFVLSDGWVRVRMVCQQDYTKTTERISTKLGWKMGFRPEKTPLPLVWIQVCFSHAGKGFFNILVNFSHNNKWIQMKKCN